MDYNSTEQTIAWFRDRYLEGTLIIKPPYQRKPVWKARQKCYLIESILMGLPIPEIYMQQTVSSDLKTLYAVVDGQQRMRAILQFIGAETETSEQEHNKFVLDKLIPSSDWHNLSFAGLKEDQRKAFIGYKLAVRHLNTANDGEIREMFRRLNKFLTPLKAQELRNATYSGPFVDLVGKYADNQFWSENRIVGPEAIRRMGDVEFISELFIGILHGPQGGGSAIIDDYYAEFEDYEDEFPDQRTAQRVFDEALKLIQNVLPDIKEHRWGNKTDFYTLFVAIGNLLRSHSFPSANVKSLRTALIEFAEDVEARLASESARVNHNVVKYVKAVEKGANDKSRRVDRQEAIVKNIEPFFVPKKRQRE
jgi:hypothetical protein